MRDEQGLRRAARLLTDAPDVTLLAHVNPDADALGSAVALGIALQRRGATVRVSFGHPAEVPESLRGLDPTGIVVPVEDVPAVPPLLVALDAGSVDRLGVLGDRVAATAAAGGEVIVLDHHVSNTRFGTINVVDDQAEATAVIVLRVLDELGAKVDEPIARCLYAGLATDTRCFRIATGGTYATAARLVEAGVDPDATLRPLLDTHPFGWMGMLATVLGGAGLEPDSAQGLGFVHAAVRAADAEGLRGEDVDSVIDILRTTREAEVAAVFKETGPSTWTVSLRATSRLDVGAVAESLGGGGHRLASGVTLRCGLEEAVDQVRSALESAPPVN
ncbi:DHH family phosphoesterase [Allokutzneria albata]|uniref:Phosphoesterase RecJ domain-containing protein n=1 Tax=Allokutzneria albata TaxID=211114 RepID=A0A1G9X705_ALLAB|nr:bifunctional oligoribonuclease/PAP phosphatase NrnA [Allokutzneria albata]SDM92529.1 phosphoesterase RecJ domain-containing protein [Allokutzneria albata]